MKCANFIVRISHDRCTVICEHILDVLQEINLLLLLQIAFQKPFREVKSPEGKLFLMDGCPRQSSAKAQRAILKIGASYLKIPPRSPDLNSIENFFHQGKKKLAKQAIINNIEKQTFEEFSDSCKNNAGLPKRGDKYNYKVNG